MHKSKRGKLVAICLFLALVLAISIWVVIDNYTIETTKYTLSAKNLPNSFDGYRIAHVSDLHNAEFGSGNEKLLAELKSADPDIIAITGDIIDSKKTDVDIALHFAKQAMQIAPCYYVTGNHEANLSSTELEKLENGLIELGVIILKNGEIVIEKDGDTISLFGIDDPAFTGGLPDIDVISPVSDYSILLSHRPEFFAEYASSEFDLVLSGHAHGGQFRLPFIGGLVAPGQGLFPKYDAGTFTDGSTTMIVSRGIGNSIIPIRFNNTPEIVLIVLENE